MRIVFFGTPEWAVPSLEALSGASHGITHVITQPAGRRGRGGAVSPSPIALAAAERGHAVIEPQTIRDEAFAARIGSERADLLVVVAYGRILPQRLLDLPRHGALNVHFSLLPRYRGAAPVQWTIAAGDEATGVTTMRMVRELDAGPIYLQEQVAIEPGEHAPELGGRLAVVGARLLLETVAGVASGALSPREQDASQASFAPSLSAAQGQVDWSQRAEVIARRVRAFDPWPGQSARSRRGTLRLLEAQAHGYAAPPENRASEAPVGTTLGLDGDSLLVACAEGTVLAIERLQPEARRRMTGAEAIRGRHLEVGERLDGGP